MLINNISKILLLFAVVGFTMSCEYKEIYDANYPDPEVYMLGVKDGVIYKVDEIIEEEDVLSRYTLDLDNNKIIIPLGVYRSATTSKGNASVSLGTDNDTIQKLIDNEELIETGDDGSISIPEILPQSAYTLPDKVEIKGGEEVGHIELAIDIPFLLENMDKRYVLAVKITDSSIKVSETMNTIVVDLNTAIMDAHPDFNFKIDRNNRFKVSFTNSSQHSLSYEWDFGDGSEIIKNKNPEPHIFPGEGTYYVKLSAEGIRGNMTTITKRVIIWNDVTTDFVLDPGNPFMRANISSGRVDDLAIWNFTPNVQTTKSGDIYVGGWQNDNNGVIDFYANTEPMVNAKVYQPITIPAGAYYAGFRPYSLVLGNSECYFVVTKGNIIPDIESLATDPDVIGFYHWDSELERGDEFGVEFDVTSQQTLTIGFVVSASNENSPKGRVKIESVFLYK